MKKKVGTLIEEELLKRLRLFAVENGKSMSEIFQEALRRYLTEHTARNKTRFDPVTESFGALKVNRKTLKNVMKEPSFYEA